MIQSQTLLFSTILQATPKHILSPYSPGASTLQYSGIFGDCWFSMRCPHHFHDRDIQFKEIYMVFQAIMRWGHSWKGHQIIFHINNSTVVSAMSLGMIQNVQVMNVLRSIIMLAAQMYFSYSSSWIASAHNALADAASCFEYTYLQSP